jgi:hypothetical protein
MGSRILLFCILFYGYWHLAAFGLVPNPMELIELLAPHAGFLANR